MKYYYRLACLVLIGLFISNIGRASSMMRSDQAYAKVLFEPNSGDIGTPMLLPIRIEQPKNWDTATFNFQVKYTSPIDDPINIPRQITFNSDHSDNYIAYIPILIKADGLIDIRYQLTFEFSDRTPTTFERDRVYVASGGFGFFAFNGRYLLDDDSDEAIEKIAEENIQPRIEQDEGLKNYIALRKKATEMNNKMEEEVKKLKTMSVPAGTPAGIYMFVWGALLEAMRNSPDRFRLSNILAKEKDRIIEAIHKKYPTMKTKSERLFKILCQYKICS